MPDPDFDRLLREWESVQDWRARIFEALPEEGEDDGVGVDPWDLLDEEDRR